MIYIHLELVVIMNECILYGLDLCGDDRQDRYVYSVELIEAAPRPTLTQAREYLTHSLMNIDHRTGHIITWE